MKKRTFSDIERFIDVHYREVNGEHYGEGYLTDDGWYDDQRYTIIDFNEIKVANRVFRLYSMGADTKYRYYKDCGDYAYRIDIIVPRSMSGITVRWSIVNEDGDELAYNDMYHIYDGEPSAVADELARTVRECASDVQREIDSNYSASTKKSIPVWNKIEKRCPNGYHKDEKTGQCVDANGNQYQGKQEQPKQDKQPKQEKKPVDDATMEGYGKTYNNIMNAYYEEETNLHSRYTKNFEKLSKIKRTLKMTLDDLFKKQNDDKDIQQLYSSVLKSTPKEFLSKYDDLIKLADKIERAYENDESSDYRGLKRYLEEYKEYAEWQEMKYPKAMSDAREKSRKGLVALKNKYGISYPDYLKWKQERKKKSKKMKKFIDTESMSYHSDFGLDDDGKMRDKIELVADGLEYMDEPWKSRIKDVYDRWNSGSISTKECYDELKDIEYKQSVSIKNVKKSKNIKKYDNGFTHSELQSLCPHATRIWDGMSIDVIWDLPSGNHPGIFISDHGPLDAPVYVCWMTAYEYLDFKEPNTPDGELPRQFVELSDRIENRVKQGQRFEDTDKLPTKEEVCDWLREMDRLCATQAEATANKSTKKSYVPELPSFRDMTNKMRNTRNYRMGD